MCACVRVCVSLATVSPPTASAKQLDYCESVAATVRADFYSSLVDCLHRRSAVARRISPAHLTAVRFNSVGEGRGCGDDDDDDADLDCVGARREIARRVAESRRAHVRRRQTEVAGALPRLDSC